MGRVATGSGSSEARLADDGGGDPERMDDEFTMRDADAILWALDRNPLLRSTIVVVALLDRDPPFERVVDKVEALCARVDAISARS